MTKKQFAVFGLGRFGISVAKTLMDGGCQVMAVDDDEDKVNDVADIVTYAVKMDVTDADALATLGIRNFDGAIIAIGENLEASVLVTILAKEMGIPYVLAKAQNDIHAKVLKKVGADLVVFPEKETGIRIANNLMMGNFFDAVELSTTHSMMELDIPEEWIGYTLRELNLRAKKKVNVIAIKRNDIIDINPEAEDPLKKDDVLVVIGQNEMLNKLTSQ